MARPDAGTTRTIGFGGPGLVRIGPGCSAELPDAARRFGTRALVVTGSRPDRHRALLDGLRSVGVDVELRTVAGEPDVATAEDGARIARSIGADLVIAIGGGAAMDAGKAMAALATNAGGAMRHLEVVGEGLPLDAAPLPVVALPTTAGTGSEATRNAVLSVPEARRKVSLRDPAMVPRVALIDPELALGAPASVTLASGLDALVQVIEPFVATGANPITDALTRDAIPRAVNALTRLMENPDDLPARNGMALVAFVGGIALASAGLGAVHGLAGPLGGLTGAPHGALCGRLLPPILRLNAARAGAGSIAAERLREVAMLMVGVPDVDRAAAFVERLMAEGDLPRLGTWAGEDDLIAAAEAASSSSSMRANPVPLAADDLLAAMRDAV